MSRLSTLLAFILSIEKIYKWQKIMTRWSRIWIVFVMVKLYLSTILNKKIYFSWLQLLMSLTGTDAYLHLSRLGDSQEPLPWYLMVGENSSVDISIQENSIIAWNDTMMCTGQSDIHPFHFFSLLLLWCLDKFMYT